MNNCMQSEISAGEAGPVFVYLMSGETLEFAQADSFKLERDHLVLIESDATGVKTLVHKVERRDVLYASREPASPGPC